MADFPEDLGPLLTPPITGTGVRFAQGKLLSWNPDTFENAVEWRGITLFNVPVLAGVDALGFEADAIVGLLGWNPAGGAGSWWIIGRIGVPPLAETVAIVAGTLLVRDGGKIRVEDDVADRYVLIEDGLIEFGRLDPDEPFATISAESFFDQMLIKTDRFLDLQSVDAIRLFSDDQIQLTSVGPMFVSSGDDLQISILSGDITANAGGAIAFESGTGDVRVGAVTTTVAAANCVVAAGAGGILRSTSAREYKADIRDFHVDPRTMLDLKLRAFRDKGEVEKNPDTDRWHVGLVADEVADAGLHAFVDYDFDGKPESVNYDRLAVALLEVVKDQQRQIDMLTSWAVDQGFAPPPAPNVTTTDLPLRRAESLPDPRWLSTKEPKEPRRRGDDLVDFAQT